MQHRFEKLLPVSAKRYDSAVEKVRACLGSHESIAAQLYSHTGETISANAIRRWFNERKVPVEYAKFFSDLTFGEVSVLDFFPWLRGSK